MNKKRQGKALFMVGLTLIIVFALMLVIENTSGSTLEAWLTTPFQQKAKPEHWDKNFNCFVEDIRERKTKYGWVFTEKVTGHGYDITVTVNETWDNRPQLNQIMLVRTMNGKWHSQWEGMRDTRLYVVDQQGLQIARADYDSETGLSDLWVH